jgi:large exoprotein involved in heme utilization and adhesion
MPVNRIQDVRNDRTWTDTRDLSQFQVRSPSSPLPLSSSPHSPIIEANAIHRHSDGTIELVAIGNAQTPQWATCAISLK